MKKYKMKIKTYPDQDRDHKKNNNYSINLSKIIN